MGESCLSTLIRASLLRSSLRHRRRNVDRSSLPAACAVRTGESRHCTRRCLALPVRALRERSNGTILKFASLRLGFRLSSRAFRTRSGLATSGVRGDLLRRDLYVRDGVVSTVPCTSSIAAVCLRELLSAVVFSRVAGAWPFVVRVCYSTVKARHESDES